MRVVWENYRLSDICTKITDGTHHSPKQTYAEAGDGRFLYITSKNVRNDGLSLGNVSYIDEVEHRAIYSRCDPSLGDILLTKDGANTGNVCLNTIADPFSLLSSVCLMKPDRNLVDPQFLLYYLQSEVGLSNIVGAMTGAAIKRIILKTIKQAVIPLPPLAEQKRIVAVLDQAFAALDRARANAEANLADAKELFANGCNEVFEALSAEYKTRELADLSLKITKGSSPKWQGYSYVDEPGILFVTSENVLTNAMSFDKTKYVEEGFNEKDGKSILDNGDVLTNIVGASIGRTAVFERDDNANINQAVCLIRCRAELLRNHFLAYLLNSPYFKKMLHEGEVNMARANLSLTFFREFEVPLPSLTVQDQIIEKIDALREKTEASARFYSDQRADLDDLRQSILQKAFAGELI